MKMDQNTDLVKENKISEYESVVELATRSRDQALDQSAIKKIEELIDDITKSPTEDPVYQVNCLQLVADLACSRQALVILEEKQVPNILIKLLEESDPLIVPHALKFFYRVNPIHLESKYQEVLNKICDYCQSDDRQLLDYAVDFIAAIGRGGYAARKVLDNHGQFKQKCLTRLGSTIISSDNLLKSRTLRCIGDLLEIHEDDPKEDTIKLSDSFYHAIISGENKMTKQLFALCKVPFTEIKINALLVMATVADMEWGQQELAAHSDFLTWLLNRSTETCKESKEAKFEILKTLVKSRTTSKYFKGEDYLKMRADFKNGPFHVGIAEEMLMDQQTS